MPRIVLEYIRIIRMHEQCRPSTVEGIELFEELARSGSTPELVSLGREEAARIRKLLEASDAQYQKFLATPLPPLGPPWRPASLGKSN